MLMRPVRHRRNIHNKDSQATWKTPQLCNYDYYNTSTTLSYAYGFVLYLNKITYIYRAETKEFFWCTPQSRRGSPRMNRIYKKPKPRTKAPTLGPGATSSKRDRPQQRRNYMDMLYIKLCFFLKRQNDEESRSTVKPTGVRYYEPAPLGGYHERHQGIRLLRRGISSNSTPAFSIPSKSSRQRIARPLQHPPSSTLESFAQI